MDLTLSLGAQPELLSAMVTIFSDPFTYGALVFFSAVIGGASPNTNLGDLNPASLLGVLLLSASAVAPVPLALGLGCLGVWLSLQLGLMLGGASRNAWTNGTIVRKRRVSAFKVAHAAGLFLLTPTGRWRAMSAAVPLIALGGVLILLNVGNPGWFVVVAGFLSVGLTTSFVRPLLWANARRSYRRWRAGAGPSA